jgi:hypothetical protein
MRATENMNVIQFLQDGNSHPIKTYLEDVSQRLGYRRAEEIDEMLEQALSTKTIGRMIVWAANKKYMRLARLLSKIVSLSVEERRSPSTLEVEYRVIYYRRVIAKKSYTMIEMITAHP